MKKLDDVNAAIEATRDELAAAVARPGKDMDLEHGYELLHKLQELTKQRDELAEINDALEVLNRHGVVYKVFTEEDVARRVAQIDDIKMSDRPKIVKHVVEGDDWSSMAEEVVEEDANIWAMISGTAQDHPEWFPHGNDFRHHEL